MDSVEPRARTPSWTVAIMCFNEAPTLAVTVARTAAALGGLTDDFEIVIVDDGSRDGSADLADRLAAADPRLRVVHHPQNRGIGEVMQSAYRAARKRWITVIPADGEFDPADLREGVSWMGDRTVVCFYLLALPPWYRRVVTGLQRIENLLLFRLRVRRVNWVKIIPAEVIAGEPLLSRSPLIETEVLVRAKARGYQIVDVPSHNRIDLGRPGGMDARKYLRSVAASAAESLKLWRTLRRRG